MTSYIVLPQEKGEERETSGISVSLAARWAHGSMISLTRVQAKCKQEHWSHVLTALWRIVHSFPAV